METYKTTKELTSNGMHLVPLQSKRCTEGAMVGSKAARLSELVTKGFPVPYGCVLTDQAFHAYCRHNGICVQAKHGSAKTIYADILSGVFPEDLKASIATFLGTSSRREFAVRSSSILEDGATHSMAGQYDTFLEVPANGIMEKIKACWAGAFNESVMAYFTKNRLPVQFQMGVIIQDQIYPAHSGVLFTLDPRTKSTDHFVLEWVTGRCDKLVSGEVTPNRLNINRHSPWVNDHIPQSIQEPLQELMGYAISAEKQFACPLDIEWCIENQNIYILQARPVTALIKSDSAIWTNVNMSENFPQPLSPFTWSIVDRFYTYYMKNILWMFGWGHRRIDEAKYVVHNLTGIHKSRIYYNLSNWYEILHSFPFGGYLKEFLDNYIGQSVPFKYKPRHAIAYRINTWRNPIRQVRFWLKLTYIHFTAGWHLNKFERLFHLHRKQWRKIPYQKLEMDALLLRIEDLFSRFVSKYYYSQGIADISVLLFPGLLTLILKQWVPEYKDNPGEAAIQLFQGLDIKSTEPARIITRLARHIRNHPRLQQLLDDSDYQGVESGLDKKMKALLHQFMQQYGARCYNECMIVSPTFEERIDLFWKLVQKYQLALDADRADPLGANYKRQQDFKDLLANRLPLMRRVIFNIVLKYAHRAIGLREQGRLVRSLLFGEIRLIALEIGKRLKTIGYLKTQDDVFYLHLNEIQRIAYGKYQFPETLPQVIAQRKEALANSCKEDPPELFVCGLGHYYQGVGPADADVVHGHYAKGTGVSGGIVEGRACVILDPVNDNRLQPGDILVTRSTDPGWTPLFVIAGGLILEKGGLLSHCAIVAREFSIPAVVGIQHATRRIKDGDRVRINGDSGEIEILT